MLEKLGIAAKKAAYLLSQASTTQKNDALAFIAENLNYTKNQIIEQNNKDISLAKEQQLSEALIDRLTLNESRLDGIINDVRNVISLKDPIGEIIDGQTLESGLRLQRKRVPLGVIGTIYESRPNVTIDVATLCLKTGNASILRGGKETIYSNKILVNVIQKALIQAKLPEDSVQFIDNPDRQYINQLLRLDQYVDIIIPRGGAALHQLCREQSSIPVITGGIGICHTFVDESADFEKALKIIKNAKTQRPSTCNTLETLLIHQDIASTFLPLLAKEMFTANVVLHMDDQGIKSLAHAPRNITPLNENELFQEWLSLDLNVCIVNDIDDAINFIRKYGSAHSDAILTRSLANAEKFTSCVDSAAVYVNASTRFTDGAQFGLGAEIAVSTQKLHARGPMGLEALTTYKWIGFGDDLIRN